MKENKFETIKRIDKNGKEFWSARELAKVLEYTDYRNFLSVIEKAKISYKNAGAVIHNHFVEANEMVLIGSGAQKEIDTFHLSRDACYLIIQNSDPTKVVVALGQTYFAFQTRKQEITENLIEDTNRVHFRKEMTKHGKILTETAKKAGVKNYGKFQNKGYEGLYGGMNSEDIHKNKGLKKSQKILDHMNSEELGANIFRATQANAKIKRENIIGEDNTVTAHFDVGQKVRKAITDLGGTMPEDLPVVDGINKVKTRIKKEEKKKVEKEK
jgi:DNA-damage-inducible protein D